MSEISRWQFIHNKIPCGHYEYPIGGWIISLAKINDISSGYNSFFYGCPESGEVMGVDGHGTLEFKSDLFLTSIYHQIYFCTGMGAEKIKPASRTSHIFKCDNLFNYEALEATASFGGF